MPKIAFIDFIVRHVNGEPVSTKNQTLTLGLFGPLTDQRNHETHVSIQDMTIDRKSWRSENAGTQIRNFIGSPNLKSSRIRILKQNNYRFKSKLVNIAHQYIEFIVGHVQLLPFVRRRRLKTNEINEEIVKVNRLPCCVHPTF